MGLSLEVVKNEPEKIIRPVERRPTPGEISEICSVGLT